MTDRLAYMIEVWDMRVLCVDADDLGSDTSWDNPTDQEIKSIHKEVVTGIEEQETAYGRAWMRESGIEGSEGTKLKSSRGTGI
ncbi:hypothetical protein Hypma_005710 [Hypsizygus marmoreus]|uniref:Uncharacterized protein n=1 Tax=Hypsizygus marmoreus TaxID=39966 RepID=A0A369KIA4_HYPMA|nr:hypothetical protein Hypma_005710 [Hypsizygus marmoreus]